MALSNGQLQQLWIAQGGNPIAAPTAAAVALAESGGNPTATHSNSDGSVDRGLWQINSVHGAQSTTDVAANTKAAISISGNGTNWRPWTTYSSGAYQKFLSGGGPANGDLSLLYTLGGGTGDTGGPIPDLGLGNIASKVLDPHLYFRIAMFILGAGLFLYGVESITGLKKVADKLRDTGLKYGTAAAGAVAK